MKKVSDVGTKIDIHKKESKGSTYDSARDGSNSFLFGIFFPFQTAAL